MVRLGFIALLILASGVALAEVTPPCQTFTSYKDVVICAMENHPDVVRAIGTYKQGSLLEGVARQRPNPEFVGKSIYGSGSGETTSTTDIDLLHTFELGGKRDSRIRQAESQSQILNIEVERTRAEVFEKTISSLYRLRQLKDESAILDESLETFGRIQKFFKNRPHLSPEQEASLGVFQLAQGDAELRKAAVRSQIRELEKGLDLAVGKQIEFKTSLLPSALVKWPTVGVIGDTSALVHGADLKSAFASLKSAQADLEAAKSLGWPDLKIGPSWERQAQGGGVTNAFGLTLAFPLPLYQTNGAGKSYASLGVERAQREAALRKSALEVERDVLLSRYNDSVSAMTKAFDVATLDKKHKSLEGMFNRGLIPSQLVIESHRQLLDFVKSRNEHELTAIEALARIRAIDGTQFLENL